MKGLMTSPELKCTPNLLNNLLLSIPIIFILFYNFKSFFNEVG